jgi:cellulose synthase/poly-beta-1,6-N-acetylglucosamine synthase-like glycosyltransferase
MFLGLLVLLFQPASRRPLLTVAPVQQRQRRARVRTPGAVRRTSSRRGPAVAVLIPAHNEAELIGATVASLQRQTRPADRVIVMADNCTDDTVAIARRGGAEV